MSKLEVDAIEPQSGTTLTLGASGDTINVASGATNNLGITMSDSWRLITDTNISTNDVISTNWEQADNSRSAEIGTALTESSGVFTLPQTGVYLIIYSFCINIDADATAEVRLEFTDDNSTFNPVATVFAGNISGSLINSTSAMPFMFGITDTANQKFRFSTVSFSTTDNVRGNTNYTESGFSIVRLGDI